MKEEKFIIIESDLADLTYPEMSIENRENIERLDTAIQNIPGTDIDMSDYLTKSETAELVVAGSISSFQQAQAYTDEEIAKLDFGYKYITEDVSNTILSINGETSEALDIYIGDAYTDHIKTEGNRISLGDVENYYSIDLSDLGVSMHYKNSDINMYDGYIAIELDDSTNENIIGNHSIRYNDYSLTYTVDGGTTWENMSFSDIYTRVDALESVDNSYAYITEDTTAKTLDIASNLAGIDVEVGSASSTVNINGEFTVNGSPLAMDAYFNDGVTSVADINIEGASDIVTITAETTGTLRNIGFIRVLPTNIEFNLGAGDQIFFSKTDGLYYQKGESEIDPYILESDIITETTSYNEAKTQIASAKLTKEYVDSKTSRTKTLLYTGTPDVTVTTPISLTTGAFSDYDEIYIRATVPTTTQIVVQRWESSAINFNGQYPFMFVNTTSANMSWLIMNPISDTTFHVYDSSITCDVEIYGIKYGTPLVETAKKETKD